MRNRQEHPPNGWTFVQPETGQQKPFSGSFNSVVDQIMALRKGNKFLAQKHGWAMDRTGIENDLEAYTVARMLAHGWTNFLIMDAPDPAPGYGRELYEPVKKKELGVAAGVRKVAAGVGVLLQWLGSGGKPVTSELAEARSAICETCPKNDGGDWKSIFTQPIADRIRLQLEMKHDMKLATTHDDKLTVCSACDCPLPLKVWTPMEHIQPHTSDAVWTALDPRCWMLVERK